MPNTIFQDIEEEEEKEIKKPKNKGLKVKPATEVSRQEPTSERKLLDENEIIAQHKKLMGDPNLTEQQRQAEQTKWVARLHKQSFVDSFDLLNKGMQPQSYLNARREVDGWTPVEEQVFQDAYGKAKNIWEDPKNIKNRENREYARAVADQMEELPPFIRDLLVGVDIGRRNLQATLHRGSEIMGIDEHISKAFNKIAAIPLEEGETLSDRMNHDANIIEQARMMANEGYSQWYQELADASSGAARSIWTSSALAPLGGYGIIAGFAATSANQALTDGKDAGLEGKELAKYVGSIAAMEGLVAGAFSLAGAAGLEGMFGMAGGLTKSGGINAIKHIVKSLGFELPEEISTEIFQQGIQIAYNTADTSIDPTTWSGFSQIARKTAFPTILSVVGQGGFSALTSQSLLRQRETMIRGWTLPADKENGGFGWTEAQGNAVFERAAKRGGDFNENLNQEIIDELSVTAELAEWVVRNEDEARELAGKRQELLGKVYKVPSRKDFEKVNFPKREMGERAEIAGNIENILNDQDMMQKTRRLVEIKDNAKRVLNTTQELVVNPKMDLSQVKDEDLDAMYKNLDGALTDLHDRNDEAEIEETETSLGEAIFSVREEQLKRGIAVVKALEGEVPSEGAKMPVEGEEGIEGEVQAGEEAMAPEAAERPLKQYQVAEQPEAVPGRAVAPEEQAQVEEVKAAVPEASEGAYNPQAALSEAGVENIPDITKASDKELSDTSKMLISKLRDIKEDTPTADQQREKIYRAFSALTDEGSRRVVDIAIKNLNIDQRIAAGEDIKMPSHQEFMRALISDEEFEAMIQEELSEGAAKTRREAEVAVSGFIRKSSKYSKDEMTGYENVGTEVERAVAWRAYKLLAQKLAQSGKANVVMVSMDTHNLGGFNKALKEKGGSHVLSNEYLSEIYSFYKEEIEAISDNARLVRLGGDEQEGIVFGATKEEVDAAIARAEEKALNYAEEQIAPGGIKFSEILHGKDKENWQKRGIGVNVYTTDLNTDVGHTLLEKRADAKLIELGEEGLYSERRNEIRTTGALALEEQTKGIERGVEQGREPGRPVGTKEQIEEAAAEEVTPEKRKEIVSELLSKPKKEHSSELLNKFKGFIQEAFFPDTKKKVKIEDTSWGWTAQLPSGNNVDIVLMENISEAVGAEKDVDNVARSHGVSRQVAKDMIRRGVAGAMIPTGVQIRLQDGSILTPSKTIILLDPTKANSTTVKHELLHWARELGFFDTEDGKKIWKSLEQKYGKEERIAEAREEWEGPNGLWEKIKQFLNEIMSKLGFEMDPNVAMAKTFTEKFWKQNPGAALEIGHSSPKSYLDQKRFPGAKEDTPSAPLGSISFKFADVKKALLGAPSEIVPVAEGAMIEDAFSGVKSFLYTEAAYLSDMINPNTKFHQPTEGKNLVEYVRKFYSPEGIEELRKSFDRDTPPDWVEGNNFTAAIEEENVEALTEQKTVSMQVILKSISDKNISLRNKFETVFGRKEFKNKNRITGKRLSELLNELRREDKSFWYSVKKELEIAERIKNGEKPKSTWGNEFISLNRKTGGYSWDFGLSTCIPTAACSVCYAGDSAAQRLAICKSRLRHTIVTAFYPKEVGKGIAAFVVNKKKSKLPFLRINGAGDSTFEWQVIAINEAIANLNRPVHIFSRSHLRRMEGSASLADISNGHFDPEDPENGCVVFKMGSADTQLVTEYGVDYLKSNLRERGIINSFLISSVEDVAVARSLKEQGVFMVLHVNSKKEIIDALDKAGLLATSDNPDYSLVCPVCYCSLESGPFFGACSTCVVGGGPCFAWGTEIGMTSDGKLIPLSDIMTMQNLPDGADKIVQMSRIGLPPAKTSMRNFIALQAVANAWKVAAKDLKARITKGKKENQNIIVVNPRSKEELYSLPPTTENVAFLEKMRESWLAFSKSMEDGENLEQLLQEDRAVIDGVAAADRAVAKIREIGEGPKYQFVPEAKTTEVISKLRMTTGDQNVENALKVWWNDQENPSAEVIGKFKYVSFDKKNIPTFHIETEEGNVRSVKRVSRSMLSYLENVARFNELDEYKAPISSEAKYQFVSKRQDFPVTSLKNEVVDDLRESVGAEELFSMDPESEQEWIDDATWTLASDPGAATRLINQLKKNMRNVSPRESAMIALEHRRAYNQYKQIADDQAKAHDAGDEVRAAQLQTDAFDQLEHINAIEEVARMTGTLAGQSLAVRKIMLAKDFSLDGLARKARTMQGGEALSQKQMKELTDFSEKVNALEKELAAKEVDNEELRKLVDEFHDNTVKEQKKRKIRKPPERHVAAIGQIDTAFDHLKNVLEGLGESVSERIIGEKGRGVKYKIEKKGVPSEKVSKEEYDTPELRQAAKELATGFAGIDVASFGEFMARVRAKFNFDTSKTETVFRDAWNEFGNPDPSWEGATQREITREAQGIYKRLMRDGYMDRDENVIIVQDAMSEVLQTIEETRASIGAYGQFTLPSQEELDVAFRDHKAQLRELAKQDNLTRALSRAEELQNQGKSNDEIIDTLEKEDLMLKATGPQRDRPSDIVRHLISQVNEQKKKMPVSSKERAGQLQSALNAAKRAVRNAINDMQHEMDVGEQLVKTKTELKADEELKQLRATHDELRKEYRKMFPPKEATEEQQIQAIVKSLDRTIAELERQIEEHDVGYKKRILKFSNEEIESRRAKISELKAHRELIRESTGIKAKRDEEQTLKRLDRSIAELQRQIDEEDVELTKRGEKILSVEAEEKMDQINALKAERKAIRDRLGITERQARLQAEARIRRQIADKKSMLARGDFAPKERAAPRKQSPSEIQLSMELANLKSEIFKKMAEYRRAHLSPIGKLADTLRETLHLSRAVMTSIDLSGVLRQGGIGVFAHPALAAKATKAMGEALVSKRKQFALAEAIRNDPLGHFATLSGLSITNDDGVITKQEEAFMGRWAEHVPGVAASGRAYTTFLNNLRFAMFSEMVNNLGRTGEVTVDEGRVIAKYINAATGRADFKQMNNAAANLNTVFFAPRYVASRFQYIATPFMLPFMDTTSRVKKTIASEYARTFAGVAAFISSMLALGSLVADDDDDKPTIEFDPRSSDFLKIKFGETRIDPTSGISSSIVVSTRFLLGETKTVSGEIKKYGKGYYGSTRASALGRFLRYKFAPIPGALWTAADDWTDPVGEKKTLLPNIPENITLRTLPQAIDESLITGLFLPLSIREISDAMSDQDIPIATALSVLAILGMSASTYGPRTKYLAATQEERSKLFKKDLEEVEWDSPPIAYQEFLDQENLEKIEKRRKYNAGLRVWQATMDRPKDSEGMDKVNKWQEDRQKALYKLNGLSEEDRREAFDEFWFTPDKSGKKRGRSEAYWKHVRALNRIPISSK